jgi:hypothetical protein
MRFSRRLPFIASCISIAILTQLAARSGAANDAWDVAADTWVATDSLGRSLPTFEQVGPAKPEGKKYVGVFYFLWLGRHGDDGPFDISKILAQEPSTINNPASKLWGPMYAPHHWGESIFHYYRSDDESVLRKHAQMLGEAGVDVIIFDVTNQLTYPESWRALCRVFDDARRQGNRVPQIAFLCPFGDPKKVVCELWNELYGKNLYPELWFRWEGKPLIMADPARIDESATQEKQSVFREFFTFRKPQPDYFTGPRGLGEWGWLEVFPQHEFCVKEGVPEQMVVGVAQNAVDGKLSVLSNPRSCGRSYHDGKQPGPEGQDASGLNFAEQWERALKIDPPFIFITGWNEWIAGRFDIKAPFYQPGPVAFVDEFNAEYSRDIEPMVGGHGDNYYYQMIANIRRYKGARPIPSVKAKSIAVDGNFDDWKAVEPEFRDTIGDPVHRDQPGWGKGVRYVNQTGRNDIVAAKVSFDEQNAYFYVRTRDAMTPPTDSNWMLLFLDVDSDAKTGWLGYDYVVNRSRTGDGETVLGRNVGGRYAWESPQKIQYRMAGNELEVAVPWAMLGDKRPASIDFKWADNIQQTGDWSDFTINGDAAPNDRFNYRAKLK